MIDYTLFFLLDIFLCFQTMNKFIIALVVVAALTLSSEALYYGYGMPFGYGMGYGHPMSYGYGGYGKYGGGIVAVPIGRVHFGGLGFGRGLFW